MEVHYKFLLHCSCLFGHIVTTGSFWNVCATTSPSCLAQILLKRCGFNPGNLSWFPMNVVVLVRMAWIYDGGWFIREGLKYTYAQIARNLGVHKSELLLLLASQEM